MKFAMFSIRNGYMNFKLFNDSRDHAGSRDHDVKTSGEKLRANTVSVILNILNTQL
jgi:hypothetical protein